MQLLHRYDGIERAMEPGQIPLDYLGDKLTRIAGGNIQDKERMFFQITVAQPLFYYRMASDSDLWNPVQETFKQFENRVVVAHIWQGWTPLLSEREIKNWLYAYLEVSANVRVTA